MRSALGWKPLPFSVGSRVRDVLGRPATVTAIDPNAENGLGAIEIAYDDGRTSRFSVVAHGLSVESENEA